MMKKLTKENILAYKKSGQLNEKVQQKILDELLEYKTLEEKIEGIDPTKFVKELFYVLDHSSTTTGYTSKGKEITTDYGYIEDFVNDLIEAIK